MRVVAAPPEHFAWFTERTGFNLSGSDKAIEALDGQGRIRGMVAYDDWTPNAVRMHVVSDSAAAGRALLSPAFQYPFEQAGRALVLGCTRADNTRALRLARHLGFQEVHRTKDGWSPGVDLVYTELRRDAWLNRQAGRKTRSE